MPIDIDYTGQLAKGALEQMNKTKDQALAQGGLDVQNRYADVNQGRLDMEKAAQEKQSFQEQFKSALDQSMSVLNSTQDPGKRALVMQMMNQMKEVYTGPLAQQYGLADYNAKMIDFALQGSTPLEAAKLQGQMSLASDPLASRKLDILEKSEAASASPSPQDSAGFKAPELSPTEIKTYRERVSSVAAMMSQFKELEPVLDDPNTFVGAGGKLSRAAGSVAGEVQQGLKAAGMTGSKTLEGASQKAEQQAIPAQKVRTILGEMVATTVKARSGANASNQDRQRTEETFGYNSGNKNVMLVATISQMQSAINGAIADHETKFPGQPLPAELQKSIAEFEAIKESYAEVLSSGSTPQVGAQEPTTNQPKRIRFDAQGNIIQ